VLLFLLVFLGSVWKSILSKGMKDVGDLDISHLPALEAGAVRVLSSGTIWLGITLMLLFMVCHMLVLSWADYSFVMRFPRSRTRWCRCSDFCSWANTFRPRAGPEFF